MEHQYSGVTTRFLRPEERLISSDEQEMPLLIEAQESSDAPWLCQFLNTNSSKLIQDLARYGALLLRGFSIQNDEEFEKTILSIPEFRGIGEAFMSEHGRDHIKHSNFVLHTNTVYKTGGTLYLGGFHTENYYSADVPSVICFFCLTPPKLGGETGLINTAKLYKDLPESLKKSLEDKSYFVEKWLVSEVADRYRIPTKQVIQVAEESGLSLTGRGRQQLILMYKPSVFVHPLTQEKALQINTFELPKLNTELRKQFINDYPGSTWFWHRFFWSLPSAIFNCIEKTAVLFLALVHSPKKSWRIAQNKGQAYLASKKNKPAPRAFDRVERCFNEDEIKHLARTMRTYYCSCLWKKGDILIVDNKKVMHAGMPGSGARLIRALIVNPIPMNFSANSPGCLRVHEKTTASIGELMEARRI